MLDKLQELATIAPDVCAAKDYPDKGMVYVIGDYGFWFGTSGELMADTDNQRWVTARGRPALAWLRDALEAAIEARGWEYEHRFFQPIGNIGPRHKVMIMNGRDAGHIEETLAAALLAALIAALGER